MTLVLGQTDDLLAAWEEEEEGTLRLGGKLGQEILANLLTGVKYSRGRNTGWRWRSLGVKHVISFHFWPPQEYGRKQ